MRLSSSHSDVKHVLLSHPLSVSQILGERQPAKIQTNNCNPMNAYLVYSLVHKHLREIYTSSNSSYCFKDLPLRCSCQYGTWQSLLLCSFAEKASSAWIECAKHWQMVFVKESSAPKKTGRSKAVFQPSSSRGANQWDFTNGWRGPGASHASPSRLSQPCPVGTSMLRIC